MAGGRRHLGGRRPWMPLSCLSWMEAAIPLLCLGSLSWSSPDILEGAAGAGPGVWGRILCRKHARCSKTNCKTKFEVSASQT